MNAKLLALLLVLTAGAVVGSMPRNKGFGQDDPLWNDTQKFYVTFLVRKIHGTDDQKWIPTIKSVEGDTVYEDVDSGSASFHDNYWAWDQTDRLWMYNRATRKAWCYLEREGRWLKLAYSGSAATEAPEFIRNSIREAR
jgi:hypothetical protein